jgi:hypothetical protein
MLRRPLRGHLSDIHPPNGEWLPLVVVPGEEGADVPCHGPGVPYRLAHYGPLCILASSTVLYFFYNHPLCQHAMLVHFALLMF